MPLKQYNIARIPAFSVGAGKASVEISKFLIANKLSSIVLVVGGSSFLHGPNWNTVETLLHHMRIQFYCLVISSEPDPESIDAAAAVALEKGINGVIGIGGGSVIDAAKALSAMAIEMQLNPAAKLENFLEGIGIAQPAGMRLPLLIIPTTAGTGSEATKNAVISKVGVNGYKRSLRHDAYIPDYAVLDPLFSLKAPFSVTRAAGLDAVTQLLESYVSTNASPFTDCLALDGLKRAGFALPKLIDALKEPGEEFPEEKELVLRQELSYAAFISGITLANAGLGVVHGAASVLGGYFSIPHGVVCGTLLASSQKRILEEMLKDEQTHALYLDKYSQAARALTGDYSLQKIDALNALVLLLERWVENMELPRLHEYGVNIEDIHKMSTEIGNKNTPVVLTGEQVKTILLDRL